MTREAHERARRLLDTSAVEGICAADQAWLNQHLEVCPDCSTHSESTVRTVSALRTIPVSVDPQLVERTRKRVLTRARELREQHTRMRGLWIACALSWLLGAVSAPLLWWGLEWIGQRVALGRPVLALAFVYSWVAPAAFVAAVLAWRKLMLGAVNGSTTTEP